MCLEIDSNQLVITFVNSQSRPISPEIIIIIIIGVYLAVQNQPNQFLFYVHQNHPFVNLFLSSFTSFAKFM